MRNDHRYGSAEADAADLVRAAVRSLPPAGPFAPRPEANGLVNLRFNENVFAGAHRLYPDHGLAALAAAYRAALRALDPPPGCADGHPGNHGGDHADDGPDGPDGRAVDRARNCADGPATATATTAPDPNADTDTDPAAIVLTRGAVDALDLVLRTFFEPGHDTLVLPRPTFGFAARLAALHAVGCVHVDLGGEGLDRLDVARILASGAKGVLLCDPNNPTSTRLHPGDVEELLDAFPGLVVIDEAYAELAGVPSHRYRISDRPNLVVLRSMSKGLGLAGLRLGAVFADPRLAAAIRAVQQPFAVPGPVLAAAMDALADHRALRSGIERFTAERDRFAAQVAGVEGVGRVFSAAGFLAVEVLDAERVGRALYAAGFASVIEPERWRGFLRVGIGTPQDNDRLVAVLRERRDAMVGGRSDYGR